MSQLIDREIFKASDVIEKALMTITKENRGEIGVRILTVVRNLNDHVAYKVWHELHPNQPMDINKVASKFSGVRQYRFIAIFDSYLRKSVSHFTPTEDGAERLMIKYYQYILALKKLVFERYGFEIIRNIDNFLEDIDEQTKDYYKKVSQEIENISGYEIPSNYDNYYVDRIKPFFVNQEIYFEVTLEPANDKPNKFNRITAFTKHEIFSNYSVSLKFVDRYINVFEVEFPIKIIIDWQVSIRPCEIDNFARVLHMNTNVQRKHVSYKALMEYLGENQCTLVNIIDLEEDKYKYVKKIIGASTRDGRSVICDILDICRRISINNMPSKNILRYLLNKMNNRIIKDQWPRYYKDTYAGLFLSSKCRPFDEKPFSFNPKGHISNLYELLECIETEGREPELLARYILDNTSQNGKLFTPIEELFVFGTPDEIKRKIYDYNESLYEGFRPGAEIAVYKDHVYNKGYEQGVVKIISKVKTLSEEENFLSENFSENRVALLKTLDGDERLDDPIKEDILLSMFSNSKTHFIYGAAGTGKTTLVNHISNLLIDKNKIFLAKTNPAVENLRRKVINHDGLNEYVTIDKFKNSSIYKMARYDLIVVDECSTVKNEDILAVLDMIGDSAIIFVGDTYQIEAIGFGNWFSICNNMIAEHCCDELEIAQRSDDEGLKQLWKEVRNMSENNVVLEQIVRNDFSHLIDDDIFEKKSKDEIILCLNYNGLYGLNNINKLLQLNNSNKIIRVGLGEFKKGDPVLFNDSERFAVLYNNLKGEIYDYEDYEDYVYFVIEVDSLLQREDVEFCKGLDYIEGDGAKTKVGFRVTRRKPFASDEESVGNEHIIPFQVAYAVSIHKSQGLEYDSVKIVIADETEDRITHNIFYTAITRARKYLTIYWSPEVCNRVLKRIRPMENNKDLFLLKTKNGI